MFFLKEGEQLDDLQDRGYKIIQNPKDYCFTSDSVLLAKFCKIRKDEVLCDLCSGSGIVPLLVFLRSPFKKGFLIELNSDACDRAVRTFEGNALSEKFVVFNDCVQNCLNNIKEKSVDVITVNPPYMELSVGKCEEDEKIAMARRELKITLEEIIKSSSSLLKFGGKFFMVNSCDRLVDTLFLMRKYKIEPKIIQYIYPKKGENANIFLIEGKMNGKKGIKIITPYYVR